MASSLDRRVLDAARNEEQRQAIVAAMVASLVLHYPLLQAVLAIAGVQSDPGNYAPIDITEVELLDGLDLSDEMDDEARDEARDRLAEEKKEKEDPDDVLDGQVVSVAAPDRRTPPPEAPRFLARHDNRTERETKRRGDPDPEQAASVVAQQGASGVEALDAEQAAIRPPSVSDSPAERPSEPQAEEAARAERPDRFAVLQRDEAELSVSPEDTRGETRPPRAGRPGPESYEALLPPLLGVGGSSGVRGTDDYLPDVDDGETTVLNTRRFKYWSFFERVKESLKRNWRPAREYRRADPTGRVYGVRDRMTVLNVVLNADGSLSDLNIVTESGVGPLDDEAVRAFRAAQPFPNPPGGLVGDNGHIQFTYALILDIESGWDFRPLRLPAFR